MSLRRGSGTRKCTDPSACLLCQVRALGGQRALEIGDGLALPRCACVETCASSTARLQPLVMVACAYHSRCSGFFTLVSNSTLWPHGNCATSCCTIDPSGVGLGEGPHVLQVAIREPAHARKFPVQVLCQAFHHLAPPALLALPFKDLLADVPVERDQLMVHCYRRAQLRGTYTFFQRREQRCIVLGKNSNSRRSPFRPWLGSGLGFGLPLWHVPKVHARTTSSLQATTRSPEALC
jgi:hypothetical protein